MKKLLPILIILALAVPVLAIDPGANFKFHRKYQAAGKGAGNEVWFNHDAHVVRQGRDCDACHLDYIDPAGGYVGPSVLNYNSNTLENSGHDVCYDCHTYENTNNGASAPTSCAAGASNCHGGDEP